MDSKSTTEIVTTSLVSWRMTKKDFTKPLRPSKIQISSSSCPITQANEPKWPRNCCFSRLRNVKKEDRPHRGWSNLKAALTSGDDQVILSEFEHGENRAVEAFNEALARASDQMCEKIKSQVVHILEAYNKITEWREVACARS